jgi:hypothetical protein
VENEILTPGGAAMRNRWPGATAQPDPARREATPSSSKTWTQQVSPDRPVAPIPCSRRAARSASRRAPYTRAAVASARGTDGSAHRSATRLCSS